MGKDISDKDMTMDIRKQKLLEQYLTSVSRYKDAMQYAKNEPSKFKRALRNFKTFGFSYLAYSLARTKARGVLGNMRSTLFFGREMIWPAGDVSATVSSMYGIAHHKSERRLTLWMIKSIEDSAVIYDVGAHLGYYTALSEEIAANGEVHAFEANKSLCGYLDTNFSRSKNVHVVCGAVSDSVGEIDFYDATDAEDSSTSSRFDVLGLHITPSKIPATTLDEYVRAGNKPPTIIKLDIEGGEYEAILGTLGLMKKYKPRILIEVWGGELGRKYSDKAVKKLQELGYKAFSLESDGSVSKEPIDDPVGSIVDSSRGARDNFLFLAQ